MKHDSMNTVLMFMPARTVGAAFGFGAKTTVLRAFECSERRHEPVK
jgi:hypothetical protein